MEWDELGYVGFTARRGIEQNRTEYTQKTICILLVGAGEYR
jgi:hypothetical protein